MIFTSYFGNMRRIISAGQSLIKKKNLSEEEVMSKFVSISIYQPEGIKGIKIEKNLQPSIGDLWNLRNGNISWKEYCENFYNKLYDLEWVFWRDFEKNFDGKILLCYEKDYKMCHRYLVGKFYKWWSGKDIFKELKSF